MPKYRLWLTRLVMPCQTKNSGDCTLPRRMTMPGIDPMKLYTFVLQKHVIRSQSYQTFIFPVFRFLLLSSSVCKKGKNMYLWEMVKFISNKQKNSSFTKKKSLVGLTPGPWFQLFIFYFTHFDTRIWKHGGASKIQSYLTFWKKLSRFFQPNKHRERISYLIMRKRRTIEKRRERLLQRVLGCGWER